MKQFVIGLAICALSACSASGQDNSPTAVNSPAIISALPALGGEHIWVMDRAQSTLEFKAHHNGEDFTGDFSDFNVAISLNPDDLTDAQVHAAIALGSIDAKDEDRNANLPSGDWFDMKAFPIATFASDDVRQNEVGDYVAAGTLTIKGIDRPVDLTFSLDIDGQTASAKGKAGFSRLDFNIGTGEYFEDESWVKFPIDVMVNIQANRI